MNFDSEYMGNSAHIIIAQSATYSESEIPKLRVLQQVNRFSANFNEAVLWLDNGSWNSIRTLPMYNIG